MTGHDWLFLWSPSFAIRGYRCARCGVEIWGTDANGRRIPGALDLDPDDNKPTAERRLPGCLPAAGP